MVEGENQIPVFKFRFTTVQSGWQGEHCNNRFEATSVLQVEIIGLGDGVNVGAEQVGQKGWKHSLIQRNPSRIRFLVWAKPRNAEHVQPPLHP